MNDHAEKMMDVFAKGDAADDYPHLWATTGEDDELWGILENAKRHRQHQEWLDDQKRLDGPWAGTQKGEVHSAPADYLERFKPPDYSKAKCPVCGYIATVFDSYDDGEIAWCDTCDEPINLRGGHNYA